MENKLLFIRFVEYIMLTLLRYHNLFFTTMKPIEALFWLGTAGLLYMTANNIVKNVKRDIIKSSAKAHNSHRHHCICW
jgi:hypothetical protein